MNLKISFKHKIIGLPLRPLMLTGARRRTATSCTLTTRTGSSSGSTPGAWTTAPSVTTAPTTGTKYVKQGALAAIVVTLVIM